MSNEIWKVIDGFKKYEASSFGNIRNIKSQKILKPGNSGGYLNLSLSSDNDNGNKKPISVHRIVALTFIPNPENKLTVNHIDHDPFNNNVENLEWMTMKEQNNNKRKITRGVNSFGVRPVYRIDKDTNEKLELYHSIALAAEWVFNNKLTTITEFNEGKCIKSAICAVAQEKRQKSAYGYKWKYCIENENKYQDEKWIDIPSELINGSKDFKVSDFGRVRNHKGRITEGSKDHSGYRCVSIYRKHYSLHRIVAIIFIPNPDGKKFVNHIDGNKENACVSNLEWVTSTENVQHAHNTGLLKTKKSIIQYDLNLNKIKEFYSITEASKELNLNGIGKCCRNKQKTCGGFIFKYKEEDLNEEDLNEDDLNEDDLNEEKLNEESLNEEKLNEESLIEDFEKLNLKTGY
jgi:hypothetical protein